MTAPDSVQWAVLHASPSRFSLAGRNGGAHLLLARSRADLMTSSPCRHSDADQASSELGETFVYLATSERSSNRAPRQSCCLSVVRTELVDRDGRSSQLGRVVHPVKQDASDSSGWNHRLGPLLASLFAISSPRVALRHLFSPESVLATSQRRRSGPVIKTIH